VRLKFARFQRGNFIGVAREREDELSAVVITAVVVEGWRRDLAIGVASMASMPFRISSKRNATPFRAPTMYPKVAKLGNRCAMVSSTMFYMM
jgi:hypothetical protein